MVTRTRLYGLDAMRGIAAICVMLLHVQAIFGGLPAVFGKAYLAVDFFFMLSGFLMARTYGSRLEHGLGTSLFLMLRYRRLWPVMAIGSLIGAPYLWSHTHDLSLFSVLFICNILLLPVSFERELFPLNVPAWSVLLELIANFAHGLGLRRLPLYALLAIAAVMLALTLFAVTQFGTLDLGARPETIFAGIARTMLSYCIGIAVYRRWGDLPMLPVPMSVAAPAFPMLLLIAWYFGINHWWFDLVFVLLACPLLLAGGLSMPRPSVLAVWLGNASFPLYAVHFAVLRQASLMGLGAGVSVGSVLAVTAAVTLWNNRKQLPGKAVQPMTGLARERA